jgi:hypothetical protein
LIVFVFVFLLHMGNENTDPVTIDSIELGGEPGGGDPNGDPNRTEEPQFKAETVQAPVTKVDDIKFEEVKPEDIKVIDIDPNVKPEETKIPQENSLQALNEELNKALRPKGTGPGEGGGPGGPGKGNPNVRTKRGLRWDLNMDVQDAHEYMIKLSVLGAQFGYPKPGTNREVYLIRNPLQRSRPELVRVSEINRIFWFVQDKEMIPGLSAELGLTKLPPALLVFFPQELEEKLVTLEADYAKKQRGREVKEDDIAETSFRVEFYNNAVRSIRVKSVKFKR